MRHQLDPAPTDQLDVAKRRENHLEVGLGVGDFGHGLGSTRSKERGVVDNARDFTLIAASQVLSERARERGRGRERERERKKDREREGEKAKDEATCASLSCEWP